MNEPHQHTDADDCTEAEHLAEQECDEHDHPHEH